MGYKLFTDGSYTIEDGIAGYGGYISGLTKTILDFSEQITRPEDFKWHERIALKRGLELAISKGIKNLTCYMDDKSLAEQVQKLNSPLIENNDNFLNDIISLKSQFKKINFFYIPREENKKADKLSRQAIKNINIFLKNINITFIDNEKHKEAQLTNYIFFHATDDINVFHIVKNKENVILDTTIIKTIAGKGNDFSFFINTVKETIEQYSHLENLTLSTHKGSGKKLENILRGKEPINQAKSDIRALEKQLNLCNNLSYYNDPLIIKYIIEQQKTFKPKTKEEVLQSIKKLSLTHEEACVNKIGITPII